MFQMAKNKLGWIIVIMVSVAPALMWFFLGESENRFANYETITHSIGQISGLIAMTMFSITFLLSTRMKIIEDYFGGMDKVYKAHGILGASAMIIILIHPIFLVLKFIPENFRQAATYLLPSSNWSVNFGIIALLGMVVLVAITYFMRIKYQKWKFTHEFFGLVFFFAAIHTITVAQEVALDEIFQGYDIYAYAVSAIGLICFTYTLLIRNRLLNKWVDYKVESVRKVAKESYEIIMVAQKKAIDYKAGQFIYVRFSNSELGKEAHPFSIASKTNEPKIKIIIKELGDYTQKIHKLQKGDLAQIDGPYGRFNWENAKAKKQVWIAAGIGITPFLGLAEDIGEERFQDSKIDLYQSVKHKEDLISQERLEEIQRKNKNFRFIPWITSEKGRIGIADFYKGNELEYYLCGPEGFKSEIREKLIEKGVPKQKIFTEEFEFR